MTGGIIGGTESDHANLSFNGGGVSNSNSSTFIMINGEISDNSGINGGGVSSTSGGEFTMNAGMISENKASRGGGLYSNNGTIEVKGGEITKNTATGSGSRGSGGGIYAIYFSQLTVDAGVKFSGNTAPTLRTKDIADNDDADSNGITDVVDYNINIGSVKLSDLVLSALAGPNKNAPAYNNYDINYPGDSYVITIEIIPDGAGSVTVSDTEDNTMIYGVLTKDTYILVPVAVGSVTFSADAREGYVFVNFVKDKTDEEITDNPADISVTGNMHVTAVFETASPPGPGDHTITSSARDGALISPTGNISVREGGDMTFVFSARSGYRISAVYVDGSPISAEALASGRYTFYNVQSNHTIEATGTPYSASPEGGDSESRGDGDPGSEGEEGNSESGRGNSGWAVLNLVFALIAIAAGIVAVAAGRNRYKEEEGEDKDSQSEKTEETVSTVSDLYKEEEEKEEGEEEKDNDNKERKPKRFIPEIVSLILGIVSVIVFFVTEDISLPPVLADVWTVLMLILMFAALVSSFLSFRSEEEENLEDWNTDSGNGI
jgi:hypothetical protein